MIRLVRRNQSSRRTWPCTIARTGPDLQNFKLRHSQGRCRLICRRNRWSCVELQLPIKNDWYVRQSRGEFCRKRASGGKKFSPRRSRGARTNRPSRHDKTSRAGHWRGLWGPVHVTGDFRKIKDWQAAARRPARSSEAGRSTRLREKTGGRPRGKSRCADEPFAGRRFRGAGCIWTRPASGCAPEKARAGNILVAC